MKVSKNNALLAGGLLFNSIAQIVMHEVELPDFVSGSLYGVGIGIMILAFIKAKPKATH